MHVASQGAVVAPVFRDQGHLVKLALVEARPLDEGSILANCTVRND
jgi:hypothetical protein